MRSNKGRDTSLELRIRSALHRRGYRYRVNHRPVESLRRTVDIAFTRPRVAVLLDGCFWHGCPEHGSLPLRNREFWHAKLSRTRERDAETASRLAAEGWAVVRVWEHVPVDEAVATIEAAVAKGVDR